MDSESLRIFLAVAENSSVTQAASRLGRAPSNVTVRIQQLESEIGAPLFLRAGKRLSLTAAGEQFCDYARRMLALEQEALHVVSAGRKAGLLRIGSMESTAASRLPLVLSRLHLSQPELCLEVLTGSSRQLIERVRSGLLDCAFVALEPKAQPLSMLQDLGLNATQVWKEDLRLLLPPNQNVVKDIGKLAIRTLAAFPLGCTYRAIAERILQINKTSQWRILEMPSYHAMIACVSAGACVALLPQSVLDLVSLPSSMRTLPVDSVDTLLVFRQGYDTVAFAGLLESLNEPDDSN